MVEKLIKTKKKEREREGWCLSLCKIFGVTTDMEGEDFTICIWFVCSLSRHEAVCAVVVLTIVMNSGNTGCCDMGWARKDSCPCN